MSSLMNVVFDSNYKINEKIRYLETCNHLGTFGDESSTDTENAEKKIKALLSIPKLRTDGLILLHTLLPQCSTKVFLENCESWTQYLLKIVKGNDKVVDKQLALSILGSLIPYLKPFPQLWKNISGFFVSSLLESILRLTPDDEWLQDSVELLSICMQHFPRPCGLFKHRIETFFINHVDSWSGKTSEFIATCVAHLPACGGGGTQGINHSTAWSEQVTQLITCLNQLLDFIYEGIDRSDDCPAIIFSSVEFPPLDSTYPIKAIFLAWHRYELMSLCLVKMLSTPFPVTVKVPVSAILKFICRVFSKNSSMMAKKASIDSVAIASVIPALHCIAFNVLEALMISCRKRLIVHSPTINKLFASTLKWTKVDESYHGTSKPYSALRVAAYQALLLWLEVMGNCSNLIRHADELVQHLLSDITPEVETVRLQSRSAGAARFDKQKTKIKHKNLVLLDQPQGECNFRKLNLQTCQETCWEALKVLKYLLYCCGALLPADLHKQIYNVVVPQLLCLRQDTGSPSSPYLSLDCRKELYSLLLACVICPSPHWPPPLPVAIEIFSAAQHDLNIQISSFCTEALAICSTIIHPRVAVLDYSVHSVSPTGSASVASDVESHVSILEQASHSREESIGATNNVPHDKDLEPASFKTLQSKRQHEDIVTLSENESEHYSEEEDYDRADSMDKRSDRADKSMDYAVSQHQAPAVKTHQQASLLQHALLQKSATNQPMMTARERGEVLEKAVISHETSDRKQFSDRYEQEVSDEELIGTEEEEDYSEEEAGYEDEEYVTDDVTDDDVPRHVDGGYKLKSESCDSNGINVSTTTKYSEAFFPKMETVHDECEIVESDDDDEMMDHSTAGQLDYQVQELVDLSESPEKGREMQITSQQPLVEELLVCPSAVETIQPAIIEPLAPVELVAMEPLVPVLENHAHVRIEDDVIVEVPDRAEIEQVVDNVVAFVSLEMEQCNACEEVTQEIVVEVNGGDSMLYLQEAGPENRPPSSEASNENVCVVAIDSPRNIDAGDGISVSSEGSGRSKRAYENADEEILSKKKCLIPEGTLPPRDVMAAMFVPAPPDSN